jgi:hypothetical protein
MRARILLVLLAALAPACSAPSRAPLERAASVEPATIVVHSSRDLEAGLDQMLARVEGVRWTRVATSGMVDLAHAKGADRPLPPRAAGGILPFSVLAAEPLPVTGDALSTALARGGAVLSEAAASVRGLERGDAITLRSGTKQVTLRVEAVLTDPRMDVAEAAIPLESGRILGLEGVRDVVVFVDRDRAPTLAAIANDLVYPAPARIGSLEQVRTPLAGRILSLGDIKRIFGEFTFAPQGPFWVTPDRAWVDRNIRETTLPILGLLKCNAKILSALRGAMVELQRAGLAPLVRDRASCYSPRMQVGDGRLLSRHAYGIAVDINARTNPYGEPPTQDPRIVEIMGRWGFAWGGVWLVPDGMHFEYVGRPL